MASTQKACGRHFSHWGTSFKTLNVKEGYIMWTGFTSIFSFPQGSCSFLPIVLVPELHTPVCEKLCSRKLQLLSWQLTWEPPESSFPPQCQSCACVLALWIAAVCNRTTFILTFPKGLGWAFLPLVAFTSYASFGGVLYYWFSSVMLVRSLEYCQDLSEA